MLNIAYLLIQLEQVAHFAENEKNNFHLQLEKYYRDTKNTI